METHVKEGFLSQERQVLHHKVKSEEHGVKKELNQYISLSTAADNKYRFTVFDGDHLHLSPDLTMPQWVGIFKQVLAMLKGKGVQ